MNNPLKRLANHRVSGTTRWRENKGLKIPKSQVGEEKGSKKGIIHRRERPLRKTFTYAICLSEFIAKRYTLRLRNYCTIFLSRSGVKDTNLNPCYAA